jgi:hypothetical protein
MVVFSAALHGRIEADRYGGDGFVAKGAELAELDHILDPDSAT